MHSIFYKKAIENGMRFEHIYFSQLYLFDSYKVISLIESGNFLKNSLFFFPFFCKESSC